LIADYTGQFLLAASEAVAAPGWCARDLASWRLSHHESLPVIELVAADGAGIGCFLGWPIAPAGVVLRERTVAPFADLAPATVERFLYEHGGRWAFVLAGSSPSRVYLDAFGSLAVVYDVEGQRIASTSTLLGSPAGFGRGPEDAGDPGFPHPNQFFPPPLTGDARVARLLPNHFLDVAARCAVRHWPDRPLERVADPAGVDALLAEIVAVLATNVRALAAGSRPYLSLTAGRDSRMLLACSREVQEQTSCFTFDDPRDTGPIDVAVARQLAEHHGLAHEIVPLAPVSGDTEREYLARIGFAGHPGKARDFLQAARRHLDLRRPWLVGFGGEIGRAYYWRRGDAARNELEPGELLRRTNLPASAPFADAMRRWLENVPTTDLFERLDLLYLELRMGAWAAPHLYGAAFPEVVAPLSHRRLVQAMLRLPAAYRREQRLARDVIRRTWPALLEHPFQRTPGPRGWWRSVRDRELLPRARRLRERLGGRSR